MDEKQQPTHILQSFPKRHATVLYRADDGMNLALRDNLVVIFGADFNRRMSHCFLSEEKACAWLETYAAQDLKDRNIEGRPVFERIDGEEVMASGLVIPDTAEIDFTSAPPGMSRMRRPQ